jgi:tripartite-type tricarboxylate transporter receptor subunit TctC
VLSLPGVNIVHIPFMGANNALLAVIAGQIDAAMVTLPAAAPFIDNKKLRGLAVSSTTRSSMLPQVPTTAEAGYPAMTGSIWGAIFVPTKTPKAVTTRLDQVLTKISAMPDFKQQLGKLGFDPADETGAQFRHEMADEIKIWTEVIAKSKLNQH